MASLEQLLAGVPSLRFTPNGAQRSTFNSQLNPPSNFMSGRAPSPFVPRLPCQRCFFKMGKHDEHICEAQAPAPGRTACMHCKKQRKRCELIPAEFHAAAWRALQLGPRERKDRIARLRRQMTERELEVEVYKPEPH